MKQSMKQKRREKGFSFSRPILRRHTMMFVEIFLEFMLSNMGFGDKWRQWIKECLASSLVLVLLNGNTTTEFKMSKELRQGDPLSPFLFLIVMEGLDGIINSAVE